MLTAAGAGLAAEGVTIRKTDPTEMELSDKDLPSYTVEAAAYKALVHKDGRVRILCGETELVRNIVLELNREVKTLGNIRQEKNDSITLREGAPGKNLPTEGGEADAAPQEKGLEVPDLPGITLRFLRDRIEIGFATLRKQKGSQKEQPPAFNLSGIFGDDAVSARSLQTGDEDALPTDRICSRHIFSFYGWYGHYWPEIEATYRDGAKLEVRGITGVSHYRIGGGDPYTNEILKSKCGYWSLRDAQGENVITLRISPSEKKEAIEPAPYCAVRPDKPHSLFYEQEPVLYHLEFAKDYLVPGRWRIEWTLEDHCQRPAGKGQQEVSIEAGKEPQVTVDLTPKEMGYFRARLVMSRPDGRAAKRAHEFPFSRIRPEQPELRELDGKAEGEMLWANILGMRSLRLTPSWNDVWSQYQTQDGAIDWDKYAQALGKHTELARKGTVKGIVAFTQTGMTDKMSKWFEQHYADPKEREENIQAARRDYLVNMARIGKQFGITAWEPINEPNLGMPPERYIETILSVEYPAIKEGNPEANFLGGSICGLDNYGWVRRLYELGGQKYFDGISFHPYTGIGFQESYRAELDQWWQILRDFNDTAGGIWMTESAWHRGWEFNDYVYDRFKAFRQSQARNAVLMHLNAEATGITREHIYDFYLVEHGYNEFYLVAYKWPTAAAISIQVMNECLRDAKFTKELPLPGKGHHLQLYRDETRTVAVAFTNDEPAELTLTTDAGAVEVTDMMGNRKNITPQAGKFRATISGDPVYMRVGAGNAVAPAYDDLRVQPDLAIPTLGAAVEASSVARTKEGAPTQPLSVAISGDWTCYSSAGALNGGRRGWDEDGDGKDKFPDWLEVKLPEPVAVSRVRVYHDYGAWERVLRDYDVQVFADGQWKTVDQVRDNRYRNIYDHQFAPVQTDRVRVLVLMVNSCLFDSIEWIPKLSTLRAVEVYAAPGTQAKAFFISETPRRRILAPGAKTELRLRLRNVTKGELNGEVRLRLPQGVGAEPEARKVSLPPEGEAECSFTVQPGEQAAEGLYTVLAGFYEDGKLACPDYACRVLCCKKPPAPPAPR